VVGSYEVARIVGTAGVPQTQILPVSGGEPVECAPDLRVRVIPSLHSCLFAGGSKDSGCACLGGLDVTAQQRDARAVELLTAFPALGFPCWTGTRPTATVRRPETLDCSPTSLKPQKGRF
jgi:hypothetical protein